MEVRENSRHRLRPGKGHGAAYEARRAAGSGAKVALVCCAGVVVRAAVRVVLSGSWSVPVSRLRSRLMVIHVAHLFHLVHVV
ncbi:hypothetical protein [Caenimonas sp. SL110]|uniref:hypothetical protein n=1 Tax=Caenimonas sp. SL110 TaxID=1450524 RepID=UPI00187242C9|nr:hypothetical protein [Caenimonas sp. SL110]